MVDIVHIDFEARSAAFLQPAAKSVGTYKYSLHPTTQVTCGCYAFDDGPVIKWAPWGLGFAFDTRCRLPYLRKDIPDKARFRCPPALRDAILSGALIAAHNNMFERCVIEHILTPFYGWPKVRHDQWICTMATARYNGLPGGLDAAAEALNLETRKSDSSAMKRMMKPRASWLNKRTGAPWIADAATYQEVVDYCGQDVETERGLYHHCVPLPPIEREIWLMDQEINMRGIPIDTDLARAASDEADVMLAHASAELAVLTGGAVTSPTQREKFLVWLQRALVIDDMQAPTIAYHLARGKREPGYLRPEVERALEIRQLAGGNALTKYKAYLRYEVDGRIYDGHRYYGGHTGRASAQHVQTQNLIKPPMSADDAEPYIEALKNGTLKFEVVENG